MPRVSQHTYQVDGCKWVAVTSVDASGTFKIKLRSDMANALGYSNVTATTLAGVELEARKAIREFTELRTIKEKVIRYNFESQLDDQRSDGISFASGSGFLISCGVFIRTTTAHGDRKVKRYHTVNSTIPWAAWKHRDGGKDMDWTEDREKFFASIYHAVCTLGIQLLDHVWVPDTKLLTANIDNQPSLVVGLTRLGIGNAKEDEDATECNACETCGECPATCDCPGEIDKCVNCGTVGWG